MGKTLQWGSRYLMVEPEHFRVDYAINPFMHLDDQPDPARTRAQWRAIVAAVEAAGGSVELPAPRKAEPKSADKGAERSKPKAE